MSMLLCDKLPSKGVENVLGFIPSVRRGGRNFISSFLPYVFTLMYPSDDFLTVHAGMFFSACRLGAALDCRA